LIIVYEEIIEKQMIKKERSYLIQVVYKRVMEIREFNKMRKEKSYLI